MAQQYKYLALTGAYQGRRVNLKADVELTAIAPKVYRSPKGTLYTTSALPGIRTLERYSDNGVCPTPCGCRVEPDGVCPHGVPSWMIVAGVI